MCAHRINFVVKEIPFKRAEISVSFDFFRNSFKFAPIYVVISSECNLELAAKKGGGVKLPF